MYIYICIHTYAYTQTGSPRDSTLDRSPPPAMTYPALRLPPGSVREYSSWLPFLEDPMGARVNLMAVISLGILLLFLLLHNHQELLKIKFLVEGLEMDSRAMLRMDLEDRGHILGPTRGLT